MHWLLPSRNKKCLKRSAAAPGTCGERRAEATNVHVSSGYKLPAAEAVQATEVLEMSARLFPTLQPTCKNDQTNTKRLVTIA